jgi:hypothetical protein
VSFFVFVREECCGDFIFLCVLVFFMVQMQRAYKMGGVMLIEGHLTVLSMIREDYLLNEQRG